MSIVQDSNAPSDGKACCKERTPEKPHVTTRLDHVLNVYVLLEVHHLERADISVIMEKDRLNALKCYVCCVIISIMKAEKPIFMIPNC
jgi:hypothetical protein